MKERCIDWRANSWILWAIILYENCC